MTERKTRTIKAAIILVTIIVIVALLAASEFILYQRGYAPGWYLAGFKSVESPALMTDKQITKITEDSFEIIQKTYGTYPLNKQGFISELDYDEATLDTTTKKKIMVIGDSFTQGSVPIYDSSFMYRLGQMLPDKKFLNFGVSGTDPVNYELILRKYLDIVKPAIVVVAFCGDNDEMNGDNRQPQNKTTFLWYTNFVWGGIDSRIPFSEAKKSNIFFPSLDSMYHFYYYRYNLQGVHPGLASRLLSLSRTGTLIGFLLRKPEMVQLHDPSDTIQHCHEHLLAIKAMCDKANVEMLLVYIPSKRRLTYKTLFPYMQNICFYPEMTTDDYVNDPAVDIHWNSQGHRKFAKFVAGIVEKTCN